MSKTCKDLCAEIYKSLMKEMKVLIKWWDVLCSCIGRHKIVKMSLKRPIDSTQYQLRSWLALLVDIRKAILKFIWKDKVTRIAEMTLKKNKVERIILTGFKMYYKALRKNIVYDISKVIDTCIYTTE